MTPLGGVACPAGVDVAAEEVLAESQPGGEVEDDLDVRTRLADRRAARRAQLYQRLRLLRDLEADLQPLGLEGTGHGEHDVGLFRGRAHEHVEVDVEVERLQGIALLRALSPWAMSRFDPKLTSVCAR